MNRLFDREILAKCCFQDMLHFCQSLHALLYLKQLLMGKCSPSALTITLLTTQHQPHLLYRKTCLLSDPDQRQAGEDICCVAPFLID